jgi:succinyl-diaminopimelate desuccinylase
MKEKFLNLIKLEDIHLIDLCSKLVQIPSDNPPGDTTKIAEYVSKYIESHGIKVELYEPKQGIINIVAHIGSGKPHLVLNGHLDQFPGEINEKWINPPHSGLIKDGKIHGRGSGDMKGGLASLLFIFCKLAKLNNLPGKITFTATSDEETGGRWGALWLLKNIKGLDGDAVLNGEPSGLTIRIGEKGRVPFKLIAEGKAAHGSFAGYVGDNAIMKMIKVLPTVHKFNEKQAVLTDETKQLTKEVMKGYKQQYGHESLEMANVLMHTTVNIGVIKGGTKDNIVPAYCEAEIDMRIPLGIHPYDLKKELEKEIKKIEPKIRVKWGRHPSTIIESTFSSRESKIANKLIRNSKKITGNEPLLSFTSGGTDCRFWRKKGIPAVSYGPRVFGMGGVDEYIKIEDLKITSKVHAGTIIDFLYVNSCD